MPFTRLLSLHPWRLPLPFLGGTSFLMLSLRTLEGSAIFTTPATASHAQASLEGVFARCCTLTSSILVFSLGLLSPSHARTSTPSLQGARRHPFGLSPKEPHRCPQPSFLRFSRSPLPSLSFPGSSSPLSPSVPPPKARLRLATFCTHRPSYAKESSCPRRGF